MSNNKLISKPIEELAPLIKNKEISPVDLTTETLNEIKEKEYINAYIEVFEAEAIKQAQQAEGKIMQGEYLGPLHGIPIALKDNLYTKGKRTTMGSKIYKNFIPDYDATVVEKLEKAGTITLGKLNMNEFAWGGTSINPHFGNCRNPWDLERIAGGSSGGSAAAVAANMATATLGTDSLGSVRIPAAACGIVSMKPSYGIVSNYGCFPLAQSMDHIGPMTKSVYDAALILDYIKGYDEKDINSIVPPEEDILQELEKDISGMIIGIEEDYYFNTVDHKVEELIRSSIKQLESLGAKVEIVKVPSLQNTMYISNIIATAEASALHHQSLVSRPEDYGEDVRFLLQLGELPTAVEYIQAEQLRQQLRTELSETFKKIDVLVAPTLPFTASKVGESKVIINNNEVNFQEHISRFTRPASLAGIPALSMPCGLSEGLPVGMQIMSGLYEDSKVLRVARALELSGVNNLKISSY